MNKITGVLFLLAILCTTTSFAQTLQEMQSQYDTQSPLEKPSIATEQTVDPNQSYKTPAEEQMAEIKAKEEAEKQALDQKLYLDTDYRFFQTMNVITLEEDALDKAYKQAQSVQNTTQLVGTTQAVKQELQTVAPQIKVMTSEQAKAADARRELILKKIAANVKTVRLCIRQNRIEKQEFKGTELTLSWEIDATGNVASARVKSSDLENKEIQKCILGALYEWKFDDVVAKDQKMAHIEYTYRFTNPTKVVAAQD